MLRRVAPTAIVGGALVLFLTAYLAADTSTVEKPMFNGNRLGWCANWGADCGEPAAEAWCIAQGFAGAEAFVRAPGVGDKSPTRLIATGAICDSAECDGFKEITCRKLDTVEPGGAEETAAPPLPPAARRRGPRGGEGGRCGVRIRRRRAPRPFPTPRRCRRPSPPPPRRRQRLLRPRLFRSPLPPPRSPSKRRQRRTRAPSPRSARRPTPPPPAPHPFSRKPWRRMWQRKTIPARRHPTRSRSPPRARRRIRPVLEVFAEPTFNGRRLDWCRGWKDACGKATADEFCRLNGFVEALSFAPDPKIGAAEPTRQIASGLVCDHDGCDGFAEIACTK